MYVNVVFPAEDFETQLECEYGRNPDIDIL